MQAEKSLKGRGLAARPQIIRFVWAVRLAPPAVLFQGGSVRADKERVVVCTAWSKMARRARIIFAGIGHGASCHPTGDAGQNSIRSTHENVISVLGRSDMRFNCMQASLERAF